MEKNNILENLIKINTIKDKENEKIRDYIKSILKNHNFIFEEIDEDQRKVLIAKRGNGKLGFICHTDTVDVSTKWQKEPLALTKETEKLFGLGVCDMKGGTASVLEAITELDDLIPCTLYFTYDEEIGFAGIKELIKAKNNFPEILIFPEPTNNIPMIANKGLLEFNVSFNGKTVHSSTPMLGENAIKKALNFINDLECYLKYLEKEKNPVYEIPNLTYNLAKINGGSEINKVPDYCQIEFDVRIVNKNQKDKINAKIKSLAKKYNANVKIINEIACTNKCDENFKLQIENICECQTGGINYVTEASFFDNSKILILGPGPITAHQCNEYILQSSYLKTIELFKKILMYYSK